MATSNEIYLQLGDIIQISAPTNPELNEQIFVIDFINDKKIYIKQPENSATITLNINEDGTLADESIDNIDILSRPEYRGYARQNGLLPNTWIDIHFAGDIPITGQITNLEEDMIEVEIVNEKDEKELIYIDFGYKGIPENIPIEEIVVRSMPEFLQKEKEEEKLEEVREKSKQLNIDEFDGSDEDEDIPDYLESPVDIPVDIPVETIKTQIKDILLDADQIEFGPELAAITTEEEVPEEQKRYGIETQTNELLDDLLSSIPNTERTRSVLNNIHIMIERFKQLRNDYSTFDDNGNANKPLFKGADFKPLVDKINNLNYKLNWILPVAQNVKKLYDLDISLEQINESNDVVPLTLAETLTSQYDIREMYKTNSDSYSTYMNKLQPSLTPFDVDYNSQALTKQTVLENFDTVIDNLDDFYSSVSKNDEMKRKRFLITRYNLGLSKLQTTELTSVKMKTKIIPMTQNDTITVNSILTFKEPIVRFSNIHLPGTSIIDKSSLNTHFLKYWKLFRENTSVTRKYINNLDSTIQYTDDTYLKHKTQYMLSEDNNDPEKFKKFLNVIIPKTKILFNLIKKYINGKLSLVTVVNYLQPFLVYLDDISFMQYQEIKDYIEAEILSYKTSFVKNQELFNKLESTPNFMYTSILYKILEGRHDTGNVVLESYGLNTEGKRFIGRLSDTVVLSPSEIIKYMNTSDYGECFNTTQTLLNIDLFTPFNFDDLLEEKNEEYKKELDKAKEANECAQYVLAKRYISLEDLTADDGIPLYFDKKYDPTVYDILDEYKSQKSEMDNTVFKNFIVDQLIQNVGLKRPDALYEATSMIDKKRLIKDGQYAVLEIDNIDNVVYYYYKREDDKWIRDETIPDNSFFGSNELFCNIQQKCIKIDKSCADAEYGSELVKKELIKEMFDEFDSTYTENMEISKKRMGELWKTQIYRLEKLRTINKFLLYKYENDKLKLIKNLESEEQIISPVAGLLNVIMGQGDFVKKQHDIVKFVKKYTRQMNPDIDTQKNCNSDICESACEYWLYCNQTNTKLLPTFVYTLASVFIEDGNYYQTITEIKNSQGVEVDDRIVDEHSGLEIEKIALSTDEGYEDSGFKSQSREILEQNAGDALFQTPKEQNLIKKELLANPKGKIINNVISTVSNNMGIVLDNYRDDIIQHTLKALDETVDSEDVHEEKVKQITKEGRKMPSYKDIFNKSLMSFTLAYISLYIAVSIPSIQSNKTFPGCKRSLIGYPINGDEDLSNITYIACVAAGIKTSVYPWKAIPKSVEKISIVIKKTLDSYVLKQSENKVLVSEKQNYLLQNEDDFIPIEHDIKNWINFLPPLQNIKNKTPSNLDNSFRNSFKEDIKTGSKDQFEKQKVIQSKIIYFSMAIIQAIQKTVSKENPILTNSSKVPFLQNACCNSGEYRTIDYFIKKEPSIIKDNDIVSYLHNINFDMVNMAQPTLLVDPQNSKIKFPLISSEFSESTIIQGFIEFCHYNTEIPVNNRLLDYCLTKPEAYDKQKTLQDNIEIMKKHDVSYSLEAFNQLLDAVNKLNIVPLDMVHSVPSCLSQIRNLIDYMIDSQNSLGSEFLTLYKNVLDTYSIENVEGNSDVRELRNYLGENIKILEDSVFDYLNKFSDISQGHKTQLFEFISNIMEFNINGNDYFTNADDETLFRAISFVKNSMYEFINVFPNIIINKVNYEEIKIPAHWKLSKDHNNDVKEIIKSHYKSFEKFYKDPTITPYLEKNERELMDFFKLVEYTNLYASIIHLNDDETLSILDNRTTYQLFKYFFLFMIKHLFELTDDKSLLREMIVPPNEEDIIVTTEMNEGDDLGEITELDVVRGEQKSIREKIANISVTMLNIFKKNKSTINYNVDMIKDKINRKKDKERHKITSTLRDMDREHREIENLFKNHRLERWGKGLQKGLTQYVAKSYDEERKDREKEQLMEKQWEESGLLQQAVTADRDMMTLEYQETETTVQRIEDEVYDMSHIRDDDDRGDDEENDDDYRLEFEEEE